MRFNKEITILLALGALAAQGSTQQLSGSVKAYAGVSGGSQLPERSQILQKGEKSIGIQSSDSGPYVNATSTASAIAGRVSASYEGWSSSPSINSPTPYGSGYSEANFRDAVRLTGSVPLTLTFRIQQSATATTTGSNAYQTSATNYGSVALSGSGVSVLQLRQDIGGQILGGGFHDVTVTLQPGRWYTLTMTAKVSGDTQDSTKPYTDTTSSTASSITSWFEFAQTSFGPQGFGDGKGTPFLESESGHLYQAPVNAVPEPASLAALAIGALSIVRGRKKRS